MTYRDDLEVATARADALQRDLDDANKRADLDRTRARGLEVELAQARRELDELKARLPAPPPATAPSPNPGYVLAAVGAVVAVMILIGALLYGR